MSFSSQCILLIELCFQSYLLAPANKGMFVQFMQTWNIDHVHELALLSTYSHEQIQICNCKQHQNFYYILLQLNMHSRTSSLPPSRLKDSRVTVLHSHFWKKREVQEEPNSNLNHSRARQDSYRQDRAIERIVREREIITTFVEDPEHPGSTPISWSRSAERYMRVKSKESGNGRTSF